MTIALAPGEQRKLDIVLIPVSGAPLISVYDVFLTSNYDPPSAADNYIHARIRNDGTIPQTCEITAYYWEAWMGDETPPPHRSQTFTINPGQVIEYLQHFHGNDEYSAAVWLVGDWTTEPLTRHLNFRPGLHLRPSQGDPYVEGYVSEVGSDYVILRYMQYGTCNRWDCTVYTPPVRPFEQSIKARWYTDNAYCSYWLVPGLLPGRLYEAHLKGGTTAYREDYVQFST